MLTRTIGFIAVLTMACISGVSAQTTDSDKAKSLLTIKCGLHGPAGEANPLTGRAFVLLKQSFNDYLKQHHQRAGASGGDDLECESRLKIGPEFRETES